jgi:hypothetical protein
VRRLGLPTNALDVFFQVDPFPQSRIARVFVNLQEGFDVDPPDALPCIVTDAEVLFVQINWDGGRLHGNIPRFVRVCAGDVDADGQPLLSPLPFFSVVVKHVVAGLAEASVYWYDPATAGTAWVHYFGRIEFPCEEDAVFAAVHDALRRGIVPLLCYSYALTIPTSSGLANPLASPERARAVIPRIVSDDWERDWDPPPDAPFEVNLHGEQLPAGLRNDGRMCFAIAPLGVLARCKAFCHALEVTVDRGEHPLVRDCVHDVVIQSETGAAGDYTVGNLVAMLGLQPEMNPAELFVDRHLAAQPGAVQPIVDLGRSAELYAPYVSIAHRAVRDAAPERADLVP